MQLAPRVTDFLDQPALDREMDILVGDGKSKPSGVDLALDFLESALDRARLSRPDQRTFASIRACAIEPRMSWRKSRRSNGNEAVNASTSGNRPRANLPRMRFEAARARVGGLAVNFTVAAMPPRRRAAQARSFGMAGAA